jgi:hypothetical protein
MRNWRTTSSPADCFAGDLKTWTWLVDEVVQLGSVVNAWVYPLLNGAQ